MMAGGNKSTKLLFPLILLMVILIASRVLDILWPPVIFSCSSSLRLMLPSLDSGRSLMADPLIHLELGSAVQSGEAYPKSTAGLSNSSLIGAGFEATFGWTADVSISLHQEAFPRPWRGGWPSSRCAHHQVPSVDGGIVLEHAAVEALGVCHLCVQADATTALQSPSPALAYTMKDLDVFSFFFYVLLDLQNDQSVIWFSCKGHFVNLLMYLQH
ncbi:hypothetical protein EJB05_24596 [Eragrostis curvula]|uniref:Uncharacterized protein n=1 Tax=Eragrostis curvula TaxID=38414 RepID=A0A5J9VBP3_9POAL|nr:hypothetical protein EJB05_24596 [Eragrostis curvula]